VEYSAGASGAHVVQEGQWCVERCSSLCVFRYISIASRVLSVLLWSSGSPGMCPRPAAGRRAANCWASGAGAHECDRVIHWWYGVRECNSRSLTPLLGSASSRQAALVANRKFFHQGALALPATASLLHLSTNLPSWCHTHVDVLVTACLLSILPRLHTVTTASAGRWQGAPASDSHCSWRPCKCCVSTGTCRALTTCPRCNAPWSWPAPSQLRHLPMSMRRHC
jgi:hypothetical protein